MIVFPISGFSPFLFPCVLFCIVDLNPDDCAIIPLAVIIAVIISNCAPNMSTGVIPYFCCNKLQALLSLLFSCIPFYYSAITFAIGYHV